MTKTRPAPKTPFLSELPSSFARIMREACPEPFAETVRKIGETCERIVREAYRNTLAGR